MVAVVPMPRVRAHKVSMPLPNPKPPLMEISYQVWVRVSTGWVEFPIFENLWAGGTGREFSNRGGVVKSGGGIDTLYGLVDAVYTVNI